MKIHFLIALLLTSAAAFAQDTDSSPPPAPVTSGTTPWSVVGKWNGIENIGNWTDVVTINDDGTFSRTEGDAGKWTLSVMKDHVVLILDWETWAPEIVTMIDPATFTGKTLEMHRVVDQAAESGSAAASGTGSSFFGTTAAPQK
jgi:hypothetical protein